MHACRSLVRSFDFLSSDGRSTVPSPTPPSALGSRTRPCGTTSSSGLRWTPSATRASCPRVRSRPTSTFWRLEIRPKLARKGTFFSPRQVGERVYVVSSRACKYRVGFVHRVQYFCRSTFCSVVRIVRWVSYQVCVMSRIVPPFFIFFSLRGCCRKFRSMHRFVI